MGARSIRDKAKAAGVEAHATEIWDPWDLSSPLHGHTTDQADSLVVTKAIRLQM